MLQVKPNLEFTNSPPMEGCLQDGEGKKDYISLSQNSINSKQVRQITINGILLKQCKITDLPYHPGLKQRSKTLRQARNLSEVLFWTRVSKGKFHQISFNRQRVIGFYIVDFFVKSLGLVIEIDGSSHNLRKITMIKEKHTCVLSV